MKHTPGPWRSAGGAVYAGEVYVAQAQAESWRDVVDKLGAADVVPDSPGSINGYGHALHGDGAEEAWANARLISAAPEMLAALIQVSAMLADMDDRSELTAEDRELRSAIRAAIRKAEGEE